MPGHSPYTLSSLTIIPFFAPDTHGLSTRPIQLSKNKAGGNSAGINRLENVEHEQHHHLVELTGIEPATPCLQSRCSPN